MRVLILDHTGAVGGAELALVRLLDALDGRQVQTRTVLFSDGPLVDRLKQHGHRVEVLPLGPLAGLDRHRAGSSIVRAGLNALAVVPFALRLAMRIRQLHPDLVHSTSLKADLIAVVATRLSDVPLVWHIHDRISPDYLPGPMVRLIRFLARHVPQAVIVNSRATAATLPHARGLVVAAPGFEPAQLTSTPPQPEQPPVVGILGRISPTKGQLVFVQAAALVRDHYPEVRFRIIGQSLFGEDAYAERVRAEVQRLALSDIVEFIGHVTNPMAELDRLQLCVHASPTPEPFGQVIVEAMVRHIPVVATRGGGATEIMTPDPGAGPLGWLVEPNDPEGLATAILSALDDPADTAARAGNAFATASRRYPIAKTADQITAVWRRVAPAR